MTEAGKMLLVQTLADKLGPMVSEHGLAATLEALALVCFENQDRLAGCFHGKRVAAQWETLGGKLMQAEHTATSAGL